MKNSIFLLIFLIVNIIGLIISKKAINYPSSKKVESDNKKTEYFQITIKETIKSDFLRVYVSTKGRNINQEIIMSTTIEEPNRANATLFAEEPYGDVVMYIPKEIIGLNSNIYLNCTCYSEKCPVILILSETNELNLTRDGQYSFLSNPSSIKHKFYIPRADYSNDKYFDQNAIMTLFVIGPPETTEIHMTYLYPNEDKKSNITIPIDYIKMDNGYIISFEENNFKYDRKGLYEIMIKSRETNYITVGSRSTVEGKYEKTNHIYPNKGIFGYFNNSMLSGECYQISVPYLSNTQRKNLKEYNLYANFIVFTETAEVYFINKTTYEEIDSKTKIIEEEIGIIVTLEDIENNFICIRPLSGNNSILYYLELNDYNIARSRSIYSPQMSGHIYTRYLPVNTHIFFTHREFALHGDEINYSVKTLQGITKSYYVYCETYPSCFFNDYTELDNEIKKGNENIVLLKGIHNMVTYSSYFTEEENVISSKQHLLLVFCLNSTMCKFETSFFSEQTFMHLKNDDIYYQHLSQKDSNLFRLHSYKKYKKIERIVFSLTTFNGDLNIELLKGHENYEQHYYYAGNKQIIIFIPKNDNSDDIDIKVLCNYNSFYSIEYTMINTTREINKFIDEGASIIQTINGRVGQTKQFRMKNNRKEENANFLVDFYSLNCKVKVKRDEELIKTENNFSQDLITPNMSFYFNDTYEYLLEVVEMDNTIKNNPLCLVQMSGFEMNSNNIEYGYEERSITIPAEYDVQINLEKYLPQIKLLYPHSNPEENVYFDFILEQELEIQINFSIESYNLSNYIISRRQLIPITKKQIKNTNLCKKNMLCCITISISANIPENVEHINVRVNAKTNYNDPTFIKRGELKKDTLIEDQISYYYTEINKNEVGYMIVNFNRASGEVFGKILNLEENEERIKNNSDPRFWLGKYNLPTKQSSNDLNYNPFTKKIYYNQEQTKDCLKACFALLVIKSTIKNEKNEIPKSYDISIAVHEDEEANLYERSIDIPVNEYIIGSISSSYQYINYFQYYTFDVPTDSGIIYIDINSDSCNLYVKIGEDKPTIRTADFIFMSKGEESVYEINVNDKIFKEMGIKKLAGLRFNFAIGTTYADTLYTTLYAFRLRTPKKDKIDLINMNTDQVGLCKIKKNNYCYFLINVKGEEKNVNEILMHAFSHDKIELRLFANILSNDIINSGNNELIKKYLPSENNADYKSTDNYIKDYLRFNVEKTVKNNTQSYILVGVHANNDTVVNFISTFYKYINNFKSNSFTKQIFLLLKDQKVVLEFPQNLDLVINIISIYGEGELLYENEDDLNDKHYLHGSYDEISFMNKNKNILVKSCNNEEFGFYISYDLRPKENYDNINYGSTTLFNLEKDINEKINFPLIYYCKLINNINLPVDFNIKILDLDFSNENKNENIVKDTNDFQILGVITTKSVVLGKKMNQYVNPDMSGSKYGSYDKALNIGKIHFSSEDIQKFFDKQDKDDEDIKNEDNYLYVTISKSPMNNNNYKKIASDVSILPSNNIKYKAHIRQYNFGNILQNLNINKYNLVSDNKDAKIMKIIFAKNNVNIDFTITNPESNDYKKNMTFIKSENKFGRNIIILEIPSSYNVYLNVFLKDKSKIDNEKLNIIFRYDVFKNREEIEQEEITLKSDEIQYKFEDNNLNLKIKPMQRYNKNVNATYSIRVIPQDNAHEEEIIDSIGLYSFENEFIYTKSFNSNVDDIEININDFPSKETYYYVSVFATCLSSKEFLAYKLITIGDRGKILHEQERSKKYRLMMIVLFSAIAILIIVFLIVIIRMKKQNTKLENEVEVLKFNFDEDSEKNKNNNKKVGLLDE